MNKIKRGFCWVWPSGTSIHVPIVKLASSKYIYRSLRMATDLNLHRKTAVTSQDTQEGKARDLEVHNRERTWILCFCLDRSFSAQMGKPHSIKEE